jgi:hypothetical protein
MALTASTAAIADPQIPNPRPMGLQHLIGLFPFVGFARPSL